MAEKHEAFLVEIVSNACLHVLWHFQEFEQLQCEEAETSYLGVVFKGFLVLIIFRVGRIDFLLERPARVFQRREIVAGGAHTFV